MSLEIRFEPPSRRSVGNAGLIKTSGVRVEMIISSPWHNREEMLDLKVINSRGGISPCRITIPMSAIGDLIAALTTIALLGDQA